MTLADILLISFTLLSALVIFIYFIINWKEISANRPIRLLILDKENISTRDVNLKKYIDSWKFKLSHTYK